MKKSKTIILTIAILVITTLSFISCAQTPNSNATPDTSSNTSVTCNHNHTYIKVTTKATCATPGIKTITCYTCNDSQTEVIPATGNHSYTSKTTTEATCATDGVKTITCCTCNDFRTEVIPATGKHRYTSKITTEATCSENGVNTFTCSVCKDSYTEAIPATGNHRYASKITTEATCTIAGIKTFTCSTCNDSYSRSYHKEHSYTAQVITSPTCTTDGMNKYTCSSCKDSYTENVNSLGHKKIRTSSPATCTKNGKTAGEICSRCNEVFIQPEVIPALGHSGQFNCTRCNINYYNVLKDYLINNPYSYTDYSPSSGTYYTEIVYNPNGLGTIEITYRYRADLGTYTHTFKLYLYKNGSAIWEYKEETLDKTDGIMGGDFSPGKTLTCSYNTFSTQYSMYTINNSSQWTNEKEMALKNANSYIKDAISAISYRTQKISAYNLGLTN